MDRYKQEIQENHQNQWTGYNSFKYSQENLEQEAQ
jgi:hypothetical protein